MKEAFYCSVVCSLQVGEGFRVFVALPARKDEVQDDADNTGQADAAELDDYQIKGHAADGSDHRSEERRVGKEC